ncbi:MAG TPA: AmmeMemoRadiSam system protein A [Pyrinomonadaceae bacterium]|nr:AmmeMemoRadiSam system protein A [Pyrinomonadaceae bacterium]
MANTSSLVFAGIAPHPPIMVPEVGQESIAEVRSSIAAMAELAERLTASGAETVVIISPHAPLDPAAFVAYEGPQLYGDFANFRAPTASAHAELDEGLLNEISRAAANQKLEVLRIRGFDLDHGTLVPLYFLQRNGWQGRLVALGYNFLSNEEHVRFGNCIRRAIDEIGRPVGFVASGDLSHRLRPEAPAGYHPKAHLFDEAVVDAIRTCSTGRIVNIDHELRRTAGECGFRSMLVALGVAQGLEPSCEVISYEAPFGVGYMVAQLVSAGRGSRPVAVASASRAPSSFGAELPALARLTIETFITTGTVITPPENASDLLSARAACFVTIKMRNGDLRGCIGTIEPVEDTLAEELISNAIKSATRDPRFPPLRANELPNLKYSVDVLSAPEPAQLEDLDPNQYGVIVEEEGGTNRGLLLPHLEGVDTVAKQLEITYRKAGITPGTPVKLFRFRADRYSE